MNKETEDRDHCPYPQYSNENSDDVYYHDCCSFIGGGSAST